MSTSTEQSDKSEGRQEPLLARINHLVIPPLLLVSLIIITYGLYEVLYQVRLPQDGSPTLRILYLHIASSWLAVGIYMMMTVASVLYLVTSNDYADLVARSAAPVGSIFTIIALMTGALWGKPQWGMWWIWDPRLTALLLLFFIYVGYMSVSQARLISTANRRISALVAAFGAINLPVIKFSVDWWSQNRLDPKVMYLDGAVADPGFLLPSLILALGLLGLAVIAIMLRVEGGFYYQVWMEKQLQSASL